MRFFTADFLFDGYTFLPKGTVLVTDDAGIIQDKLQQVDHQSVQHITGLLMPGMINAHCHLELSHLKNVVNEGTGLVYFLLNVNKGRHDYVLDIIQEKIAAAEQEMMRNGIVAVGDISNSLDTLSQKQKNKLHYHTFVECFGLLESNAQQRFEASKAIHLQFQQHHPSSVVLHAPYSISNTLIQLVDEFSQNQITTIHNQECPAENELFKDGTGDFLNLFQAIIGDVHFFKPSGKSSLQTYLPQFIHQQKMILVHNTVTSEEDLIFAQKTEKNIAWCLCPNANLYIENSLPNIPLLMKHTQNIVLGTDSLASSHQLNIVLEMQVLQQHFPQISLQEKLQWATLNGSIALGFDEILGSFDQGKKPGLVQIKNVLSQHALPEQPIIQRII